MKGSCGVGGVACAESACFLGVDDVGGKGGGGVRVDEHEVGEDGNEPVERERKAIHGRLLLRLWL